jgi:rhodanese-related sulfurtransferase
MSNFLNELSVIAIPAAAPQVALAHFERILSLETDCWDVHAAVQKGKGGFVLLDVRSPEVFEAGHVLTAINLPYRRIHLRNLVKYPKDALFVVYCNGPHCNAADKAALRLARLGRPVKKMIGGIEGWKQEGFALVTSAKDMTKKMTPAMPNSHAPQSLELGETQRVTGAPF